MHFRKLIGKMCYLSPVTAEDAETYTTWLNDQEVVEYLTLSSMVISLEGERGFLENLSKDHTYTIVDIENDKPIGSVGLLDISQINQSAEIGILIGDKSLWSRGFGREALSLLIDYAFMKLNLNNIMLRVYSYNERAIKCYKSVGFKEIGKIREALIRNRKRHDIHLFDLLPTDFYRDLERKL